MARSKPETSCLVNAAKLANSGNFKAALRELNCAPPDTKGTYSVLLSAALIGAVNGDQELAATKLQELNGMPCPGALHEAILNVAIGVSSYSQGEYGQAVSTLEKADRTLRVRAHCSEARLIGLAYLVAAMEKANKPGRKVDIVRDNARRTAHELGIMPQLWNKNGDPQFVPAQLGLLVAGTMRRMMK